MIPKKYFTEESRLEARRARNRAWRAKAMAADPEKFRERDRLWAKAHPEKIHRKNQVNSAVFRAKHSESCKAEKRLYKAKRYGCPVELLALWDEACRISSCEVCGTPAKDCRGGLLHKDHSHTDPPEPRGVLCGNCNRAIGLMKDDPDRLSAAVRYLRARDPRYRGSR